MDIITTPAKEYMQSMIKQEIIYNMGDVYEQAEFRHVDEAGIDCMEDLAAMHICVLVLTNGFKIIGKSAPADYADYKRELGDQYSREDAYRQLGEIYAYQKRDALAAKG